MNYKKLLLNELRYAVYTPGTHVLSDERIARAVTLNENLQSTGYMLSPDDLMRLAASDCLDGFWEMIRSLQDSVDVEPMYPGFPSQVMQMDEAVFRFHQLLHYFSTYGLESVSGEMVKQGWLPERSEQPKAEQKRFLPAKLVRLLEQKDMYLVPLRQVLVRKERMTLPEKELLTEAVRHISAQEAEGLTVGFKENLEAVFEAVFAAPDRETAAAVLRSLCGHTGDVLRCIDRLLTRHRFHFRTSEKRFLVKLLESYPVGDLRANLVLSGKNARRNILLLQYLDYSVYSRSADHLAAVNALRDGELRSWESTVQTLLRTGDSGALDFIAARPGMMLRMTAWLMRLGYSRQSICRLLTERAEALSVQTLVTNLNHFGRLTAEDRTDAPELYSLFEELLKARLSCADTPLRGKRVKLCLEQYDLDRSELRCSGKSAEGGFLPGGIALRLPAEIDALRFFVYWNDEHRVDVDLHAGFTDTAGHPHSVGWDTSFRDCGVVYSGDITHSNAAEYIDIDLTADIDRVYANIHLFSGQPDFASVDTCYVGMMAVPPGTADSTDTALYSEANCFFRHDLRQKCQTINYGYVDVRNRCLIFDGIPAGWDVDWYLSSRAGTGRFTLARYLELLLTAQGAELSENAGDADLLLVMGKPDSGREISLIDSNFFMETV